MSAKEAIKALIKRNMYQGIEVYEINNDKHEIVTISTWIPRPIKDYIQTHYDIVGEERNRIVFK